jgi:hypothetical protein
LVFNVANKVSFVLGAGCRAQFLVDVSLDGVVVLMEACDLGAEGVGRSVESGDVNWNDHMIVREGSGHFYDFFKDHMVS